MTQSIPPISILGVNVHPLTLPQLLARIEQHIHQRDRVVIANVNVHAMNIACRLPWFRDFLNQSALVFCDGAGVQLGARLLGHTLPQRMTYADWTWDLAARAAQEGWTLFFVGARPDIAAQAAARLRARYPGLRSVGTQHGYFDQTPGTPANEAVLLAINSARPDILIVGFGMPAQEHWLWHNAHRIDARVLLTGGAVFDYVSGSVRRGPAWMTDNGLEWLARLVFEPRRLWRRYLLGNPLFLWRVLRQRVQGLTSRKDWL